jgi:hypothetical protein
MIDPQARDIAYGLLYQSGPILKVLAQYLRLGRDPSLLRHDRLDHLPDMSRKQRYRRLDILGMTERLVRLLA